MIKKIHTRALSFQNTSCIRGKYFHLDYKNKVRCLFKFSPVHVYKTSPMTCSGFQSVAHSLARLTKDTKLKQHNMYEDTVADTQTRRHTQIQSNIQAHTTGGQDTRGACRPHTGTVIPRMHTRTLSQTRMTRDINRI